MSFTRRSGRVVALGLVLAAVACAEPPNKELHEAQGAIDAARAAGADRYAAEELSAAVRALGQAQDAVAQRDYRLALNHALDSRERAQNAARDAAVGRAAARSHAERLLADVTAALAAATTRLEAGEAAKLPRQTLAESREQIASVQRALQEAGAALGREDYQGASRALDGYVETARAAAARVDEALAAPPPRPARRRR